MKNRIVYFDIAPEDTAKTLKARLESLALRMFLSLDVGKYQMTIGKPTRTRKQNDTIHPIFREIANTMAEHGLDQRLTIKARPTEANIKTFFREKFLDGKSTSMAKTNELAKALDLLLESFNKFFRSKGIKTVHIESEELKSLLNS